MELYATYAKQFVTECGEKLEAAYAAVQKIEKKDVDAFVAQTQEKVTEAGKRFVDAVKDLKNGSFVSPVHVEIKDPSNVSTGFRSHLRSGYVRFVADAKTNALTIYIHPKAARFAEKAFLTMVGILGAVGSPVVFTVSFVAGSLFPKHADLFLQTVTEKYKELSQTTSKKLGVIVALTLSAFILPSAGALYAGVHTGKQFHDFVEQQVNNKKIEEITEEVTEEIE